MVFPETAPPTAEKTSATFMFRSSTPETELRSPSSFPGSSSFTPTSSTNTAAQITSCASCRFSPGVMGVSRPAPAAERRPAGFFRCRDNSPIRFPACLDVIAAHPFQHVLTALYAPGLADMRRIFIAFSRESPYTERQRNFPLFHYKMKGASSCPPC